MHRQSIDIAIIGGGPSGLMAADVLCAKGHKVHLFDAMASLGRKFLMAGKSGLNLTHAEEFETFLSRYTKTDPRLEKALRDFGPKDIQNWAHDLGVETFVGSSGRIFPVEYKAAPLLRGWISKLKSQGLETHVRHFWKGFDQDHLIFETPSGLQRYQARATLFAVGGKSWPSLGSDGRWLDYFDSPALDTTPFQPSNCGFEANWSEDFKTRFQGAPVKTVALKLHDQSIKGEFVITDYGVEGSAIYRLSSALIAALQNRHSLSLDLVPDLDPKAVVMRLERPRGRKSLSDFLKNTFKLSPVKVALLRECLDKETFNTPAQLARALKDLKLPLIGPRPIEEAISSKGGVCFDNLDDHLMVKNRPGIFMAGEMLDWDAPTGGYLLSACFALGRLGGLGMDIYLTSDCGERA